MGLPSSNNETIASGQLTPQASYGEVNNITFLVQQLLNKIQTVTLVKIIEVTNAGELSPVGFVDVQPLVNQIDGLGNPTPHGVIHNVPYMRMQGGTNAIILDPIAGDIGLCVFASRDVSKVKSTKTSANPGSYRVFSFSDALYVGGMLNGTPTQVVQFNSSGISVTSPNSITIDAPDVSIECETLAINASASVTITTPNFTVNAATTLAGTLSQTGGGAATISGPVAFGSTVTANGKNIGDTHTHGGVTTGGGTTGAPT